MEAIRCPSCGRLVVMVDEMRRPDHRPPDESPPRIVLKECWPCRVADERGAWMRYEAQRRALRP